jgi:hypothetical protein
MHPTTINDYDYDYDYKKHYIGVWGWLMALGFA